MAEEPDIPRGRRRRQPQESIPAHQSPLPPLPFPPGSQEALPQWFLPQYAASGMPQTSMPVQPEFAATEDQPSAVPLHGQGSLDAHSPEPQRILQVLESLKTYGFNSMSDFLYRLFENDDPAVKRRVSIFYSRGGARTLMETFMRNRRAKEHGGDEIAVRWATETLKDEFESGLVKGGVNVDVRANSQESGGRTTGEILKDGLEGFDLGVVQVQCEQKAPLLWHLFERLSSADRAPDPRTVAATAAAGSPDPSDKPVNKRRKADVGSSGVGHSSNIPLTVAVLLLLLASSQVRNKFQKWLGLYLYAQGVRKGPLNSLRALGVGSEGKVIGDNVLRVVGDDMKKKLRAELGVDVSLRTTGGPRSKGKRRSVASSQVALAEGVDPLENKRQFAVSSITYHPSPKDHLRADNFMPCATIPFIIRLPLDTPVLIRGMVKSSAALRRQKFFQPLSHHSQPDSPQGYYGYSFGAPPTGFPNTSAYSNPMGTSGAGLGTYYLPTSIEALATGGGPSWVGGTQIEDSAKLLLLDAENKRFWKNRIRRAVWRAMARLWPGIGGVITEEDAEVNFDERYEVNTWENQDTFQNTAPNSPEDDLLPLPSMKRRTKNIEDQMSILDGVCDYLGFDTKHLKGATADRLWLWYGNLEMVGALRAAKFTAPPDSCLHNTLPVLQLFDIRQNFLLELLKLHYGVSNDKDPSSLCHHMASMNRKFLIFGFSVTGQYAEGLMMHSLESHLIASILTVTRLRQDGPATKAEAIQIVDKVYGVYFDTDPSDAAGEEHDQVFENHTLFMKHAIVYSTLLESIAKADTSLLMEVLRWMSVAFQAVNGAAASRSLARELMNLAVGLKYEYSPPLAQAILHTLFITKPLIPQPGLSVHPAAAQVDGKYQETDFAMKQLLRQTKTVFDLRDNPKHEFFREVVTPNIRLISTVVRKAEGTFGTTTRTANQWKSPAESVDPDKEIPKLVQELREARVAERVKGRKANFAAEDLATKGEEVMRSRDWCDMFCGWADGEGYAGDTPPVATPANSAGTKGKKNLNLFHNEEFAFDWGL